MLAVVPNTMIFESPSVAFISSLMREKRVGNVSSTVGITTEYCGTFSNVGGSDVSMLVKSSESAFIHKVRLLRQMVKMNRNLSLPRHVSQSDVGCRRG